MRSIALPTEEKREDQTQHNAYENAGDDRKIKRAVFALDANVAGKFAQKSCADAGPENDSENNNCDTDDYEKFSHLGHDSILVSDPVVSSGVVLPESALRVRLTAPSKSPMHCGDLEVAAHSRPTVRPLTPRSYGVSSLIAKTMRISQGEGNTQFSLWRG